VSVSCGVATLVVTYRIASRLVGASQALIATFFLAVCFLHVRESHFGMLDVPVTLPIMASFGFLLRAWRDERPLRSFLIAGFLAGLATSLKYNAGALAFVAGVVALIRIGDRPADRRRTLFALTACGAAMIVTFLAGSPYVLLAPQEFLIGLRLRHEHILYGHFGVVIERAWLHHFVFGLRYGLGVPLLAASLAGIAIACYRHWRTAAILLTFPAVSYLVIGVGHVAFVRYLVPIAPFLCLTAAVAVWSGVEKIRDAAIRSGVAAAVTIAIAAPSLMSDVAMDRLLLRPDTRVLAAQWLAAQGAQPATTYAAGETFSRPFLTETSNGPRLEFAASRGVFVWGERQSVVPDPEWIVIPESPLPHYSGVASPVRDRVARGYTLRQTFLGARARTGRVV